LLRDVEALLMQRTGAGGDDALEFALIVRGCFSPPEFSLDAAPGK